MSAGRPRGAALIFAVVLIALFLGVTVTRGAVAGPIGSVTPQEIEWAGKKLRTYCQSCHGVGSLRFIRSESNASLWSYIFTVRAPNSGKLWKNGIIEVLSWPSDTPPDPDRPMDPAHGRDWMPKGGKRTTFAADKVDGTPSRRILIDLLQRGP